MFERREVAGKGATVRDQAMRARQSRHSRDGSIRRVAVLRALPGLGDMLCAVPALRALRAGLPRAHITLIGLPSARGFAQRFERYLDDFIVFPGFPGIPETDPAIRQLPQFFASVHRRNFDLAIQMHGSGICTNHFTALLDARITAGFFIPGNYCPDEERFLPYPEELPEVWRLLRLMEFLGMPLQGDELEFPIFDEEVRALESLGEARELLPGEYVCVHPGANETARRWSPEQFAWVADALAVRGLRVALTGTQAEAGLTRAVARAMKSKALDLAGRTSLGALAALIRNARLLVCNDTGVSHLAAALRTPSVVIFTASDPVRWAPLDGHRHRAVGSPGESDETEVDQPDSEEVLAHAETLLEMEGIYVA